MRGIKRHSKPTVRVTRAKRACSQSALVEPAVLDPVEELTGSDTEGTYPIIYSEYLMQLLYGHILTLVRNKR